MTSGSRTSGSRTSGSMMRSGLVAIVLATMFQSGSAAEKLSSCCESVGREPITAPILSFMVQVPKPPCVLAVIFQTEEGLFCSPLKAAWVHQKIRAFRAANDQKAALSSVSLLSITTSTASPSVSSSSPSSSPSVSSLSSSSPSVSSSPVSLLSIITSNTSPTVSSSSSSPSASSLPSSSEAPEAESSTSSTSSR